MLRITDTEVFGFKAALRDMRNPKESWDKADTQFGYFADVDYPWPQGFNVPEWPIVGPDDLRLARKLVAGGSEHRKFLRQIVVNCVIEAPRYLWQEIDTYKVATVRNSCSTMHKLGHRELTVDDFVCGEVMPEVLLKLNGLGCRYRKGNMEDYGLVVKMKRLLPEGFLQKAGWHMSYETALSMFRQRRSHRLAEWRFTRSPPSADGKSSVCDWIWTLPWMSEFIGAANGDISSPTKLFQDKKNEEKKP